MMQESKNGQWNHNQQNCVGKFIPSPLAVFVSVNNDILPTDSEDKIEPDFNDEINNIDEDDFNFMFSNEIEPIIGAYRDTTPLLLA